MSWTHLHQIKFENWSIYPMLVTPIPLWVFNVKCKKDGSIDKFKTRLVEKNHTRRQLIEYKETSSLIVRFSSILLMLAIVSHLDLELFKWMKRSLFNFFNIRCRHIMYIVLCFSHVSDGILPI